MKLRDIMTHSLEVVPPDCTLREAAQKMDDMDVGALPVCENDRLIGIITDRDIIVRAISVGADPNTSLVRDSMTQPIICCFEDQDVQDAAKLMETKQVRRLPVLDQNKRLVGIISLADIADTHDRNLSGEVLEHVSSNAA